MSIENQIIAFKNNPQGWLDAKRELNYLNSYTFVFLYFRCRDKTI